VLFAVYVAAVFAGDCIIGAEKPCALRAGLHFTGGYLVPALGTSNDVFVTDGNPAVFGQDCVLTADMFAANAATVDMIAAESPAAFLAFYKVPGANVPTALAAF
jgi:hypothetical protein